MSLLNTALEQLMLIQPKNGSINPVGKKQNLQEGSLETKAVEDVGSVENLNFSEEFKKLSLFTEKDRLSIEIIVSSDKEKKPPETGRDLPEITLNMGDLEPVELKMGEDSIVNPDLSFDLNQPVNQDLSQSQNELMTSNSEDVNNLLTMMIKNDENINIIANNENSIESKDALLITELNKPDAKESAINLAPVNILEEKIAVKKINSVIYSLNITNSEQNSAGSNTFTARDSLSNSQLSVNQLSLSDLARGVLNKEAPQFDNQFSNDTNNQVKELTIPKFSKNNKEIFELATSKNEISNDNSLNLKDSKSQLVNSELGNLKLELPKTFSVTPALLSEKLTTFRALEQKNENILSSIQQINVNQDDNALVAIQKIQAVTPTQPVSQTSLIDASSIQSGLSLKSEFSPNLALRIQWIFQQALSNAEILMDPPELGPLSVKLSHHNGETNIVFQVSNSQTKDMLENNLSKLKDLLAEQGINLGDTQVEHQQNGDKEKKSSHTNITTETTDVEEPKKQLVEEGNVRLLDTYI